jgi:subtilisin
MPSSRPLDLRGYVFLVFIASLVAACVDVKQDSLLEPERSVAAVGVPKGEPIPRFPELPDTLLPVPLPAPVTYWAEMSDDDLVERIREANGRVMIGIKAPETPRTRETSVVPGISRAAALAGRHILESLGVEITQSFRFSSDVAAVIEPEAARLLRRHPVVDYLEPSIPFSMAGAYWPDPPPPQDTAWGAFQVNAHWVWDKLGWQSNRGELASITILDIGLDSLHVWERDGDGPAKLAACVFAPDTGPSCYDYRWFNGDTGHGAHVAGIVAARNNAYGFLGIAHNPAWLAFVKIYKIGGEESGPLPQYIKAGLEWAIAQSRPRHIVNMSIVHCIENSGLNTAIAQAHAAGILLIASAGNITDPNPCVGYPPGATGVTYPASHPFVMAVSGTLEDDSFAVPGNYIPEWPYECLIGSRYGPEVEIAAPFFAKSMTTHKRYAWACGTSMSAPVVTGVAALTWTRFPTWTASQIRQRLKDTAWPYSPSTKYGSGRVHALPAVYVPPQGIGPVTIHGPERVRPYDLCTYLGWVHPAGKALTYEWFVAEPWWVQDELVGTDYHLYHAATESFRMFLRMVDPSGEVYYAIKDVEVAWDAPECLQTK